MLPSISFETGRRTQTQSSVRPSVGQDSKWKSGSITNRNRGREANTRGEETKKNLYPALLRSASGELLPLDKDLSWKSGNPARLHGRKAAYREGGPVGNALG